MSFAIHDAKNDAISFAEAIFQAITEGVLRHGDITVLDNAAIHFQSGNDGLVEWLYHEHHVMVIPLPTQSPELNSIELSWRALILKLQAMGVLKDGSHACADAAYDILCNMNFNNIKSTFK